MQVVQSLRQESCYMPCAQLFEVSVSSCLGDQQSVSRSRHCNHTAPRSNQEIYPAWREGVGTARQEKWTEHQE